MLTQLGNKLAHFVGDKNFFGLQSSHSILNKKYSPDMLTREFPYEAYDPHLQIFYNQKSQGFVLEAIPLTGVIIKSYCGCFAKRS
jgi:hypothetical protein